MRGAACQRWRGDDLQLRVHLLLRVCLGHGPSLPELRRRARREADQSWTDRRWCCLMRPAGQKGWTARRSQTWTVHRSRPARPRLAAGDTGPSPFPPVVSRRPVTTMAHVTDLPPGADWVAVTEEPLPVAEVVALGGPAAMRCPGRLLRHRSRPLRRAGGCRGALEYEADVEQVEPRLARIASAAHFRWPQVERLAFYRSRIAARPDEPGTSGRRGRKIGVPY